MWIAEEYVPRGGGRAGTWETARSSGVLASCVDRLSECELIKGAARVCYEWSGWRRRKPRREWDVGDWEKWTSSGGLPRCVGSKDTHIFWLHEHHFLHYEDLLSIIIL